MARRARQTVGDPADLRLVVTFLRSLRRWTQEELSRASGDKVPTRKTLQRLAAGAGLPYRFVEILLPIFRAARLTTEGTGGRPPETGDASEDLAAGLDQAILDTVLPRLAPRLMELEALVHDEGVPKAGDRPAAAKLWEALEKLPAGRRRLVIETEPKYWTWALAERLCEESERAAAHQADAAAKLARLALRAAELVPGNDAWRSSLLGWVWAFVANARRVQGDLPGAEEGFLRSDRLWEAGASADRSLLDATRPLDLKATLRRCQGRFD
jgi:transcriptional regulator with XRE-family HTH domain